MAYRKSRVARRVPVCLLKVVQDAANTMGACGKPANGASNGMSKDQQVVLTDVDLRGNSAATVAAISGSNDGQQQQSLVARNPAAFTAFYAPLVAAAAADDRTKAEEAIRTASPEHLVLLLRHTVYKVQLI